MVDTFGPTLRHLRKGHGYTQKTLAPRIGYSHTYLSNVENGHRPPTLAFAQACDTVLGASTVLVLLCQIEIGADPMLRRHLLGGSLAAASTVLLATADGTAALAATLGAGLNTAAGVPDDWDQTAADFARRHLLAPSNEFGAELAAHITMAEHAITTGGPNARAAARGAALLTLTYGLWLADTGRIPTAHNLYASSASLADHAQDPSTQALVRARAANRGIYEGWSAARAHTAATRALALTTRGPAAVEAFAALVHLHALTGNHTAGEVAVAGMQATADAMTGPDGEQAQRRTVSFRTYLQCRTGTLTNAQRAYAHADTLLAKVPLWHADATIYMGRAMIAAGDLTGGAALVLQAIKSMSYSVRILGIGVRDALTAAGGRHHRDLDALRGYASTGPAPWDTI